MGTPAVHVLAAALAVCTLALAVAAARFRTRARQALHAAHHDWLTGLPNRRNLDQRLTTLARSGRAAAIAMLDLDRFKHINDTLGHPAGDQILIAVAHRLRELPADAVFRQGGDEFVMLIDATDPLAAAEVAKQAWQIITTPRLCDSDGNQLPQGDGQHRRGVHLAWMHHLRTHARGKPGHAPRQRHRCRSPHRTGPAGLNLARQPQASLSSPANKRRRITTLPQRLPSSRQPADPPQPSLPSRAQSAAYGLTLIIVAPNAAGSAVPAQGQSAGAARLTVTHLAHQHTGHPVVVSRVPAGVPNLALTPAPRPTGWSSAVPEPPPGSSFRPRKPNPPPSNRSTGTSADGPPPAPSPTPAFRARKTSWAATSSTAPSLSTTCPTGTRPSHMVAGSCPLRATRPPSTSVPPALDVAHAPALRLSRPWCRKAHGA